jgi:hypothetical protein
LRYLRQFLPYALKSHSRKSAGNLSPACLHGFG